MGHVRLGSLPRTKRWQQVVALLQDGADVAHVAVAAAKAVERDLAKAADEPTLVHAFWLLMQLPLAAKHADFAGHLRQLGLSVSQRPDLFEIIGAFADAVDAQARRAGRRSDLGEMAQLSAVESLSAIAGRDLPGLFEPTADEVRQAIGRLAGGTRFPELVRDFFARLTRRHLDYYLSRELSNHLGREGRFTTVADRSAFDRDLDQHCREASRILKEFAGGWFGKTLYEDGRITPEQAGGFIHFAFKKMRAELRKRRDADG
jgi:hypothetical protein